jgi:hypothetical protein
MCPAIRRRSLGRGKALALDEREPLPKELAAAHKAPYA